MRFVEGDGNDRIPLNLIKQVKDGRATFLAGAGVSIQSNLPSFKCLTRLVYKYLGENMSADPIESDSFDLKEYDRTLGLLEKRILIPGLKSEVRMAVEEELKFKVGKEPKYHEHLLNLSRDSNGRIRIMTTNFDTLFERAAKENLICWKSHALSTMPKPGSGDDFGILHLHGRIADKEINLEGTSLILTSSDFGNAYLRDSWVSKYIEDRIRIGPLVLVGYSADDVAMRMLLEAIDADRIRISGFKKIYALDKKGKNSKKFWKSKGIDLIGFEDYPSLYETIREWSKYNSNPDKYIQKEISNFFPSL